MPHYQINIGQSPYLALSIYGTPTLHFEYLLLRHGNHTAPAASVPDGLAFSQLEKGSIIFTRI